MINITSFRYIDTYARSISLHPIWCWQNIRRPDQILSSNWLPQNTQVLHPKLGFHWSDWNLSKTFLTTIQNGSWIYYVFSRSCTNVRNLKVFKSLFFLLGLRLIFAHTVRTKDWMMSYQKEKASLGIPTINIASKNSVKIPNNIIVTIGVELGHAVIGLCTWLVRRKSWDRIGRNENKTKRFHIL